MALRRVVSQSVWDRTFALVHLARMAEALQVLENPTDYLRVRLLGNRRVLRFKDGFSFECGRADLDLAFMLIALEWRGAALSTKGQAASQSWTVSLEEGVITTPSGIRFSLDSCDSLILAETFLYDVHFAGHDLRGKLIVDVGAHRGDTALYYAEKGASVLAFEPDPANFEMMERNLALNPMLASRVQAFPWAVGTDGTVSFHAGLGGGSGLHAEGGRVTSVKSVSLRTIVDKYCDTAPFLLKADCKGCEYQIVEEPALSSFYRVAVEYSPLPGTGGPDMVMEALRLRGFEVTRLFKQQSGFFSLREHGIICAERTERLQDLEGAPPPDVRERQ